MPRAVTVKAIEFDWIFNNTQGYHFLESLSETESIDIFGVELIVTILNFLWGFYKWKIIYFYLFPFLLYTALFILDSTLFHKKRIYDRWGGWFIASFISNIIICILSIYFICMEAI